MYYKLLSLPLHDARDGGATEVTQSEGGGEEAWERGRVRTRMGQIFSVNLGVGADNSADTCADKGACVIAGACAVAVAGVSRGGQRWPEVLRGGQRCSEVARGGQRCSEVARGAT